MTYVVVSSIDKSEPVNPVLRVTVSQVRKDEKHTTRTYSMSLRSVDPEKHEWCQSVVTTNFVDFAKQVEHETKEEIKRSIRETMDTIGISL